MPLRVQLLATSVALIALSINYSALGQSVQAVRNIVDEAQQTELETKREELLILVAQRLALFGVLHKATAGIPELSDLRTATDAVITTGRAVLDARHDHDLFTMRIKDFNEAVSRLHRMYVPHFNALRSSQELLNQELDNNDVFSTLPIPQISLRVPDVVFTVGPGGNIGDKTIIDLGLSTNLLGAAAGSAFDALGSSELAKYFKDNISVGTTLPLNGDDKLNAVLGLGLGGLDLKRVTLWPVLNIQQFDSSSATLPDRLLLGHNDESEWSAPVFSVAVVPIGLASFESALKKGRPVFIPTLGVRLPFYFPDNPFSALAAMFSNRRSDFVREGPVQLVLGLSIPLLRVGKVDAGTNEAN